MKDPRFSPMLLIAIAALCVLNIGVILSKSPPKKEAIDRNIAQNTYLGPTQRSEETQGLVRVELIIRDSPDLAGLQIQSVTFDGQAIPLKPRGIFGKRGDASFQLLPGKYSLRWKVNRDKMAWPRTISYEEEVNISKRDLWVQITIEGDKASIR